MGALIAGVTLWSFVHLFPALAPGSRARLAGRLGSNAYRGLFSLLLLAALVLMVLGWRSAVPASVYAPPLYGSWIVPVLVFIAFFLFAASHAPGNTRRLLRHPMLLGTATWAAAHLLANGDQRAVVLFGGLGLWALVSIPLINRRDGARTPPPPVPVTRDLMTFAGAAVVFTVVALLHRLLFGVPPFPGL